MQRRRCLLRWLEVRRFRTHRHSRGDHRDAPHHGGRHPDDHRKVCQKYSFIFPLSRTPYKAAKANQRISSQFFETFALARAMQRSAKKVVLRPYVTSEQIVPSLPCLQDSPARQPSYRARLYNCLLLQACHPMVSNQSLACRYLRAK